MLTQAYRACNPLDLRTLYELSDRLEDLRLRILFTKAETGDIDVNPPMDQCKACKKKMVLKVEEGLYVCKDCHTTRRYVSPMDDHKDTELHAQDAFLNHALRTRKV